MFDKLLKTIFYDTYKYCIVLVLLALSVQNCDAHGRLIEPPSRASAWRYGFQTPPNYNDHELYCGGFTRQWKRNGGKCGECGDAWDIPQPRPHEMGGQWGQGVIVRRYEPATAIPIRVELTASHMGYFEFRLCEDQHAKQDCLDKHLLKILGGSPMQPHPNDLDTRFYPRNGSRIYEIKVQLPDMKCANCVLQWRYIAGNNWGMCDDGNGAVGCGPQEEFRSCSDIAIGINISRPLRPVRPTLRTTTVLQSTTQSVGQDEVETPLSNSYNYVPILVTLLVLFIIVCCISMWYLHRFHDKRIKQWFETLTLRFSKVNNIDNSKPLPVVNTRIPYTPPTPPNDVPPVPPPRTRRNSKIKELSGEVSSIA